MSLSEKSQLEKITYYNDSSYMKSRKKNGYSKSIRHCLSHGVGLDQEAKDA